MTMEHASSCGNQVNFFIRKIFFWICLEIIKMLEGHFNLLDTFLTLDGFKNYKVMVFEIKFDLNESPQNLLQQLEIFAPIACHIFLIEKIK